MAVDVCRSCGSTAEFCCSRCRAKFCTARCYRDAWPQHKAQCRAAGAPAEASAEAASSEAEELRDILTGRIFISIAAYCDSELPVTLKALLTQAAQPDALFVGLVWQGEASELMLPEELQQYWPTARTTGLEKFISLPNGSTLKATICHGNHLRIIRMPAEDARGPCWARYLAQLLWEEEELFLQLDSHMRFVAGWDQKARQQLRSCRECSAKPILCSYGRAYPHGMPYNMVPPNVTGCLNCAAFFDANNILNIRYRSLQQNWDEPRESYFWSAHFSFSSAKVLREVPYDPRLLMLFFGEEILMTVRFFTHGWDLFSPSEGLVYHLWERNYRRVYAEDMKELYQDLCRGSRRRLHGMLGSGPGAFFFEKAEPWPLPGGRVAEGHDPFELGQKRTVLDYERSAGVSFKDRKISDFALRGGALSEECFLTQETGDQTAVELQCQSDMQKMQGKRWSSAVIWK